MSVTTRAPGVTQTLRLLAAWLPIGLAGWLLHRILVPGPDPAPLLTVIVITGLAVAGTLATRLLLPRIGGGPAVTGAVLVGAGWALANAAGWAVGVEVAGPAYGVATGLGLAVAAGRPAGRLALLGTAALIAMIAGWLLVDAAAGPGPTPAHLVTPTLAAVTVVALAGPRIVDGLAPRPVVLLTCGWAVAWVACWAAAVTWVSPASFAAAVLLEITVAAGLGALVLGRLTGEAPARTAARWAGAAALAVAGGAAVAVPLHLVLAEPGRGVLEHMDLGTSLGLAPAIALAVLPTLRRVRA